MAYNFKITKFNTNDNINQVKTFKRLLLNGKLNTNIYRNSFRFASFTDKEGINWCGWTNWIPGTLPTIEVKKIENKYHLTVNVEVFGKTDHNDFTSHFNDGTHQEKIGKISFQGIATLNGVVDFENKTIEWEKRTQKGYEHLLKTPVVEFTDKNAWEKNQPLRQWYSNNHPTWNL